MAADAQPKHTCPECGGAARVQRFTPNKPVRTWLDRTALGRTFSGREWADEGGGRSDD